jgi:hypothetical protein
MWFSWLKWRVVCENYLILTLNFSNNAIPARKCSDAGHGDRDVELKLRHSTNPLCWKEYEDTVDNAPTASKYGSRLFRILLCIAYSACNPLTPRVTTITTCGRNVRRHLKRSTTITPRLVSGKIKPGARENCLEELLAEDPFAFITRQLYVIQQEGEELTQRIVSTRGTVP